MLPLVWQDTKPTQVRYAMPARNRTSKELAEYLHQRLATVSKGHDCIPLEVGLNFYLGRQASSLISFAVSKLTNYTQTKVPSAGVSLDQMQPRLSRSRIPSCSFPR